MPTFQGFPDPTRVVPELRAKSKPLSIPPENSQNKENRGHLACLNSEMEDEHLDFFAAVMFPTKWSTENVWDSRRWMGVSSGLCLILGGQSDVSLIRSRLWK